MVPKDDPVTRRRALKFIGALAAAVAATTAWAGGSRAQVGPAKDPARARRAPIRPAFGKGGDATDPRVDELFSDAVTPVRLPASERAIIAKTRAYAKGMAVARRPTSAESLVAKQAMREAERDLLGIADRLAHGAISTSEARVAAKAAFRTYFERLEAIAGTV